MAVEINQEGQVMFNTKITMNTQARTLGVFLHHPGNSPADPLPDVATGSTRVLAAAVYAITAAGTGAVPGTIVEFVIETAINNKTRKRTIRPDGTLNAWVTFQIDSLGKVS